MYEKLFLVVKGSQIQYEENIVYHKHENMAVFANKQ